jgi:membrane fusion protein (multidrug efflux system)
MNGVATQVEQIQLGRFVMAGRPVFSVIDVANPWVDANPKESDFTYVAVGQSVTLDVDAFPNHCVQGHGRLALARHRRAIRDPAAAESRPAISSRWCSASRCGSISTRTTSSSASSRPGMSVYATIDTNHRRSLATCSARRRRRRTTKTD